MLFWFWMELFGMSCLIMYSVCVSYATLFMSWTLRIPQRTTFADGVERMAEIRRKHSRVLPQTLAEGTV